MTCNNHSPQTLKEFSRIVSLAFISLLAASSAVHGFAADTILVESRKTDNTVNTPEWSELSGKWAPSKNKSRLLRTKTLIAPNVSVCVTNAPAPAFKVSPTGLHAGEIYQVAVTFGTSSSNIASPDLVVAVSTAGISASTIPTNTPAFQGSGADSWNVLGNITVTTNSPSLTFTYVSGTLSRQSRWYADAIRFIRQSRPESSTARQ